MTIQYCLPIIKSQAAEVISTVETNLPEYSYFEVWLDYIEDADKAFVGQLVEMLDKRLVILFRRQNLEAIQMDLERRFEIIETLHDTNALLDLDVNVQAKELNYIQEHDLRVNTIASYHNYQQTPDSVQLGTIIDTMKEFGPMIYKLSTMCHSYDEALRLLEVLAKLKAADVSAIVLGMGESGQITRVFGALMGNEMTFAPHNTTEASAPGQLTRQQYVNIFKELGL